MSFTGWFGKGLWAVHVKWDMDLLVVLQMNRQSASWLKWSHNYFEHSEPSIWTLSSLPIISQVQVLGNHPSQLCIQFHHPQWKCKHSRTSNIRPVQLKAVLGWQKATYRDSCPTPELFHWCIVHIQFRISSPEGLHFRENAVQYFKI